MFRPVPPGPPDESILVKPIVPEFIPPIQYGIKPQRLCLRRSDSEILTGFDDDVSSVRDDCTALVMSDPVTFRETSHDVQTKCDTCVPQGIRKEASLSLSPSTGSTPAGLTAYLNEHVSAFLTGTQVLGVESQGLLKSILQGSDTLLPAGVHRELAA